jgi:hypothetical protein
MSRKHWKDCKLGYLSNRLHGEALELDQAIYRFKGEPTMWEEAADVANFAAMMADKRFDGNDQDTWS